jgi:hypothetical protein
MNHNAAAANGDYDNIDVKEELSLHLIKHHVF